MHGGHEIRSIVRLHHTFETLNTPVSGFTVMKYPGGHPAPCNMPNDDDTRGEACSWDECQHLGMIGHQDARGCTIWVNTIFGAGPQLLHSA